MKTELRRTKRDGNHSLLESIEAPSVAHSSAYVGRVTMLIGKKHILQMDKETAEWLGRALIESASKA